MHASAWRAVDRGAFVFIALFPVTHHPLFTLTINPPVFVVLLHTHTVSRTRISVALALAVRVAFVPEGTEHGISGTHVSGEEETYVDLAAALIRQTVEPSRPHAGAGVYRPTGPPVHRIDADISAFFPVVGVPPPPSPEGIPLFVDARPPRVGEGHGCRRENRTRALCCAPGLKGLCGDAGGALPVCKAGGHTP